MQYRGHAYFESIRPSFIFRLLQFLETNNPLYYDTEIHLSNTTDYMISYKESEVLSGDEIISDYVNLYDPVPVVVEKLNSVRKNIAVVIINQMM